MKNKINRKFKMLFLIISVLFIVTGCRGDITFTYAPSDRTVEYNPNINTNAKITITTKINEKYDDLQLIVRNCDVLYILNGNREERFTTDVPSEKTIGELKEIYGSKLTFSCEKETTGRTDTMYFYVVFSIYDKNYEITANKILDSVTTEDIKFYPKKSLNGSNSIQSIQIGVESELLNKIGGISEYCNYDETLHYNELPSSANMFSKIAYSQVNCATTKYSSSYDNGISFINWVFEKNGASTRLPSTYNEVITWAGNKIFTADAKGTNIQAGDLVILGNDSTSPIEIVVQVNSNSIKTVGYKTSGNNKVIYETSHNDMLNGKRIIKMNGVSY